jgi:hypothetical protein
MTQRHKHEVRAFLLRRPYRLGGLYAVLLGKLIDRQDYPVGYSNPLATVIGTARSSGQKVSSTEA